MIIVQKGAGKLSEVEYYKADVEDYSTFKRIGVWRSLFQRISGGQSVYFKIKLTTSKNLKGIILGFKGYGSIYDHQFDILVEIQEYDGTSWNTIRSKTIKFPPDWYYKDDNFYYCDVPIVYDIELETPVLLDSTELYRVRITPSEDVYITSYRSFREDGTEYIYRILYSNETKNYEAGDIIVVRDNLELDVDTIERYDQASNLAYDRYVSIIILNGGKFKITNDSPEDIKLKGSIIITPSPNNGVYIGTEAEPIYKDKKITITLGYGLTGSYYGSPYQAINDGFFIYTEKVEQEEATIIGFNSRHEIILEGILDKWVVGDEINVPIDYLYTTDTSKTITSITYDTGNNRTIVTLDSDLKRDPLIGEKVFMLSQSVTIKGYRVRYFTTSDVSKVKYDKSQEVLRGVRCENILLSAKNMTEDSYVVLKDTMGVKGWHLGTLVFPRVVNRRVELSPDAYIKRIAVLNYSTIYLSVYNTLIDEFIVYNGPYGIGNMSYIKDRTTINKLIIKCVGTAISMVTNTLMIINEIEAYNVNRLFDVSYQGAGGAFIIGLLKGRCEAFGGIPLCRVIIEKAEEIEPFDDPIPTTSDSWRGYLDVRICNIGKLPNTGMFCNGRILVISTGDGLPDTTKKSGKRAYKILLKYGYGKLSYTIPIIEENKPIAIQLAVKFSDSFVSSEQKQFKVKITMPDGNTYEKEVTDFTTEWQYISVSGTSAVKGIATVEYEMKAVSDSYLYIDDEVLLTGYVIDMSGAETWQNGLPTYPPIKTFISGLDVWSVPLDALTIPNTTGEQIKNMITQASIDEVKDEIIAHRNAVEPKIDETISSRASQTSVDNLASQLSAHDSDIKDELSSMKGSGFSSSEDSLSAISNKVDSASSDVEEVKDKLKKHDSKITGLLFASSGESKQS